MALMVSIIAHTYMKSMRIYIGTILFVLALAGCAEPEEHRVPYFAIPRTAAPAPPSDFAHSVVDEIEAEAMADSARRGTGALDLPVRGQKAGIGRGPAPIYAAPTAQAAPSAPTSSGPVTGYGAGGMQQPPGSPTNPTYASPAYSPGAKTP
jgi:hypothetical protein